MPLIPYYAYDGDNLLPGLSPDFTSIVRLNADLTVTDLFSSRPANVDKGGGLYAFDLSEAFILPNSSINYVIALGGAANPSSIEGHLFANSLGQLQEVDNSSYIDQGIDQRNEVLQGAVDSLVYWVKNNGAAQAIDSASAHVTLMDNTGTTKVARALCTISDSGKLSVSKTWDADSWILQEDAIALWEWTVGSIAFSDRQYFDIVKNKLYCPIDTAKLLEVYPDLELHLSGIGETDVTKFIKRAWAKLLVRIRSGHNRPSLILDKHRLVEPALELTLFMVCRALSRNMDDLWWQRKKDHEEDYKHAIASLGEVKYDRNEDGVAEQRGEDKRLNRRKFTV